VFVFFAKQEVRVFLLRFLHMYMYFFFLIFFSSVIGAWLRFMQRRDLAFSDQWSSDSCGLRAPTNKYINNKQEV